MDESKKKLNLAAPKPSAPESEQRGWTPEEVAAYIRFQLSELAAANGHHEFERLCFQVTRKRIYPNVIPSTGPVSAGGDQGSDFETFEVGPGGSSPFFAKASDGKVVFACSIEKDYRKKIKDDLGSIAKAEPSAKKVKFFFNRSIAVGIRHKLQKQANETHRIDLEIFDSLAISELLADPEVFWIATQFLSIPSDVFLRPSNASLDWYEDAKKLEVDAHRSTVADFLTVKRAVRYATRHRELHSDLPALLGKIRTFQANQFPGVARRAFYEDFVASLRGLEFVQDLAGGLQQYFEVVPSLTETAEIEDAAVLISYAFGAGNLGMLKITLTQILGWRKSLLNRIDALLKEDISPGRRASLLDASAFLTLLNWAEEVARGQPVDTKALALQSAEQAFKIWRRMLKYVRESPMFPLGLFARRLAVLAGELGKSKGYEELSGETDKLLASRAGQQKVGEQAFERAKAYSKAGLALEAIDQLHIAHISSFTRETALHTVYVPLFLAKLYANAKLFAAAKYYALASSFAALKIGDEELRSHIYRGLAEAAASDHANGASIGFFATLKATELVASHFSAEGTDNVQDFEWGRLHFYAFVLTYAASFVSKELAEYLIDELLPSVGLRRSYDEALPDVEGFFGSRATYSDLAEKAITEGVAPPFSDALARRTLSWKQLGVTWTVDWENNYQTTATAEGFIALLQIMLTDLRNIELSLFPTYVDVSIELAAEFEIGEIPSNERVVRRVFLPAQTINPELVFGAAATILKMVSAYKHDKFLGLIEQRVKKGVLAKTNPHAPYEVLFREFYSKEDFEILHKLADGALKIPPYTIETHEGLRGPVGIHKDYNPAKSRQEIKNRYRRSTGLLKYTLPRLVKDGNFRSVRDSLRKEGWKDWHILLATAGVRLNFVVGERLPRTASPEEHMRIFQELLKRDEAETDEAPPPEIFTIDQLRFSLKLSQLSTLKGMGLDCWQETPVTAAVDAFLRRFNYWSDDVLHVDPFV
jgi:hypothetical protein